MGSGANQSPITSHQSPLINKTNFTLMRNYEVTFIVDPTLPNDEIKSAAKKYVDMIKKDGNIIHIDEMGSRQLAYPIKRRNTGIYYCVEFEVENGAIIDPMELAMRRDESLLRFLTVKLDKYGVKYNEDKRAGKIGKVVKKKKKVEEDSGHRRKKKKKKRPQQQQGKQQKQQQPQKPAAEAKGNAPAKKADTPPADPPATN